MAPLGPIHAAVTAIPTLKVWQKRQWPSHTLELVEPVKKEEVTVENPFANPLDIVDLRYTATCPHAAATEDEVSFATGDTISVSAQNGRDAETRTWWFGTVMAGLHYGNSGWFPSSCVQ